MKTKLLNTRPIAEGTMQFEFEKPKEFTYRAGQSIDLFLIDPPETDDKGNKRAFSLTSAPGDNRLSITTRMRDSAFKRVLGASAPGTEFNLEGPFGDMTLHENPVRPAVFLAGGIGITPFYSMATDAATRSLPHRIFLFYSNRRPEDAAFLEELLLLSGRNQNFTLVATMTEMDKSAREWHGPRGYIDADMVGRYVDKRNAPVYYIAGPAGMVTAMKTMLEKSGISRDDVRTEEFSGY